jgi:hypothetical protein
MSTVNPQLSDWMLGVGMAFAMALKVYYVTLIATGSGVGFFAKYRTQRQRYVMLAIAQAIVGAAVLYALSLGSLDDYWKAANEWSSAGLFGTMISWLATLALFSPLITVLCALSIYLWPATFAKSAGGGKFYTTAAWRMRKDVPLTGLDPYEVQALANKFR